MIASSSSSLEETPSFTESLILCKELVEIRYFPAFELCISLLRDCFALIHPEELPSLITFSLAALSSDFATSSSDSSSILPSSSSANDSQNLEFLLNLWREHITHQEHQQQPVLPSLIPTPSSSDAPSSNPIHLAELVESLYLEDLSLTISLLCTFSDAQQVESVLQRADTAFPKLSPSQRALLASYVMALRQTGQFQVLTSPSSPSSLLDFIASAASEENSSAKVYYDWWLQSAQHALPDSDISILPSLDLSSSPTTVSTKPSSDIKHRISQLVQEQKLPQAALLLSQSSLNRLPLQMTSSLPYNLLQLEIYLKTKSK